MREHGTNYTLNMGTIINISKGRMGSMQQLAARGCRIVDMVGATVDEIVRVYDEIKNVYCVIVDEDDDPIKINDIINAVRCPVVTPGIEVIVDTGQVNFIEYE